MRKYNFLDKLDIFLEFIHWVELNFTNHSSVGRVNKGIHSSECDIYLSKSLMKFKKSNNLLIKHCKLVLGVKFLHISFKRSINHLQKEL